jgi:hypothetical protein
VARPARTVVSRPGPRPPYQALTITAPKISRKGTSCGIRGSRRSLIPSATPTTRMATPYRKSGEVRFIEFIWALYLSNVSRSYPLMSTLRLPLLHLHVLTLPFCGLATFRAYPICGIFECLFCPTAICEATNWPHPVHRDFFSRANREGRQITSRTNVSTIDRIPGPFEGLVVEPAANARESHSLHVIPNPGNDHAFPTVDARLLLPIRHSLD